MNISKVKTTLLFLMSATLLFSCNMKKLEDQLANALDKDDAETMDDCLKNDKISYLSKESRSKFTIDLYNETFASEQERGEACKINLTEREKDQIEDLLKEKQECKQEDEMSVVEEEDIRELDHIIEILVEDSEKEESCNADDEYERNERNERSTDENNREINDNDERQDTEGGTNIVINNIINNYPGQQQNDRNDFYDTEENEQSMFWY